MFILCGRFVFFFVALFFLPVSLACVSSSHARSQESLCICAAYRAFDSVVRCSCHCHARACGCALLHRPYVPSSSLLTSGKTAGNSAHPFKIPLEPPFHHPSPIIQLPCVSSTAPPALGQAELIRKEGCAGWALAWAAQIWHSNATTKKDHFFYNHPERGGYFAA